MYVTIRGVPRSLDLSLLWPKGLAQSLTFVLLMLSTKAEAMLVLPSWCTWSVHGLSAIVCICDLHDAHGMALQHESLAFV